MDPYVEQIEAHARYHFGDRLVGVADQRNVDGGGKVVAVLFLAFGEQRRIDVPWEGIFCDGVTTAFRKAVEASNN